MWDFKRGQVVCVNCGTVLDTIYYYSSNDNGVSDELRFTKVRGSEYRPSLNQYTRTYIKLMQVASRHGLAIDNDVFMKYVSGRSPLVKVFKRPGRALHSGELNEELKIVLDIMKNYPKLTSRTERAKLALAKLALSIVREKGPDIKRVSKELGISEVHARRLYRALINEPKFITEVQASISRLITVH